jgi:hypothetical protein
MSRLVTVVAVVDVPDDYDAGQDAEDGFPYALSRVPGTRFGVAFYGVSGAAVAAGTSEAGMQPSPYEQSFIDANMPAWADRPPTSTTVGPGTADRAGTAVIRRTQWGFSLFYGGALHSSADAPGALVKVAQEHGAALDIDVEELAEVTPDGHLVTPLHPKILRVLDLSTAHLPESYAERGPQHHDGVVAYTLGDYGWLMWVPLDPAGHGADYDLATEAPELLAIQLYARAAGCSYVRFDRDADPTPGLPTWAW